MTTKTYNQYCSIAHALDTVGDRWTLLAVRNLLLGPKRFSDLMKGLPGISTNILTERLKLLEERALIGTRYLPPPAASTVYELTAAGYALTDVLIALARWGSLTLGEPEPNSHIVLEGIAFMVQGVFLRRSYPPLNMTCNLEVQGTNYHQTFGVKLSAGGVNLSTEALPDTDLRLQIGLKDLSDLSSGRARLSTLIEMGTVSVKGLQETIKAVVDWVDTRS